MSDLDALLAEQSAFESAGQGRFTVDPARQRELLGRLGLLQSEVGFLKVAQGAYLSGTDRLSFKTGPEDALRIVFRPASAPTQPLWESGPLGLGLLALSQDYHLEWSWCLGDCLVTGRVHDGHFGEEHRLGQAGAEPAMTLQVRPRKTSWWKRSWTGSVGRLLTARLGWMPISLSWNGQPMQRPQPPSALAEALVYAMPAEGGDLWLPIQPRVRHRRVRCGDREGEEALVLATAMEIDQALILATAMEIDQRLGYRGWAMLGVNGSSWSRTTFVLHGVALEPENNLLDRPGIVAVVSAAGLSGDLGGLTVVHDQAFRERLQSLRKEVSWLDSLNALNQRER